MGIFGNAEFTAKEKAELDLPLPENLAVSQIVQLWSDNSRRQEVFLRLMQQAIENRKLKIQQSKYNMLLYLNEGRIFDYSKVYKDGDDLYVEWSLNGVNGQCNSQVVISKYDFIAWFKSENEPLPTGCFLEKWWKEAGAEAEADVNELREFAAKTTNVADAFSEFRNLRSNEISIVMMEDKTLKMVIKGKIIKVFPDQLGLSVDSQGWKLLEGAAFSQGDLSNALRKLNSSSDFELEKRKIKTAISRLRKNLKHSMGLIDDPITYLKGEDYKFTFKSMIHECLKDGNVSRGADAMDYIDHNGFDDNQYVNSFWSDDE